jgi:glutathione S-transferase
VAATRPTIADLSLAGYLYCEEETGFDRTEFKQVARWACNVRALPRWKGPYELLPRAMEI